MANQWFRFKQFTINQDRTAMKVGTDGVLVGAWANLSDSSKILDVGTGTGLIAIMAAQRNATASIDAIEVDNEAFNQAKENVQACAWSERINLHLIDFSSFCENSTQRFDHIIINPPFYNSTLKPGQKKRAVARHNESLGLSEIIEGAAALLYESGRLSMILPAATFPDLKTIAQKNGFFVSALTYVKPTPSKAPHRILVELNQTKILYQANELIIEEFGRHQYSDAYKQLTESFYL
ncbi:tRNA1(Val) (adenine(37)-N6)-methyltransferase [Salinivirga cyanobacteriivorans]